MYTTLISAQQLHNLHNQSSTVVLDCRFDSVLQQREQQKQESVVILDCRFDLMKPSAGELAYTTSHIPGALYAHLERDLSGPITSASGRHPLPVIETLAKIFGDFGIDAETQVVVYDTNNGMMAARAWWLLRWLGHSAVAVLDGGLQAWQQADLPLSQLPEKPVKKLFIPSPRMDMVVTAANVADLVKRPDWRVLDARAPERYRGEVEPIDPVAGHIPGARNSPFAANLNSNAQLLAPSELQSRFAVMLENIPSDHVVAMCGSGVTACHLLLAMEHAGLQDAKLYAGSWSEWIRDPDPPIAKNT
jgi:thiosulfate/3-mercaptopyruvate sulfurtransferase